MPNKTNIQSVKTIEDVASFCRRKGFVFSGSEIYGGLAGFWDYGPLGVELKNRIKAHWWKHFVQDRDDVVGIDGAIVTKQDIWIASGHVSSFKDVISTCSKCKKNVRVDHLIEDKTKEKVEGLPLEKMQELIDEHNICCPSCKGGLSKPQYMSLMFKTNVGPVADENSLAYLRPETCQTIFVNFKNVLDSTRIKLPFGIAQAGKAFRNEIAPRDFVFRSREFEQLELEFFMHPEKMDDCKLFKDIAKKQVNVLTAAEQKKDNELHKLSITELVSKKLVRSKWHAYWIWQHYNWFLELGVDPKNMRLREHTKDELSHYSSATFDIEYNFPFGWKELGGIADRGQFDLSQHMKFSKVDLTYFDDEKQCRVTPAVIEPSQGVDRAFLVVLLDAYEQEAERVVLRLKPALAPIQVAVFPLVSKDKLPEKAKKVYESLKKQYAAFYDEAGSIGKRYRRMDESGTPYCITIDHQTLEDNTITIRDRDSMKQKRVKIEKLAENLEF